MTPSELFQEGKLTEAVEAGIAAVKANPSDRNMRYFLAELMCMSGQWERADRQLDTVFQQADDTAVQVVLFRHLIRAETARAQLVTDGRLPEFLFEVPDYLRLHLDASIAMREGKADEAVEILARAEEQRPPVAGKHMNSAGEEQSFDDFRDLDDLVAPFFEVLTSTGKYYWVPIDKVNKIEFRPPKRTQDLIWRSAAVDVEEGPEGEVYIPTIYLGTGESGDDQLRIGRGTDWTSPDAGPVRGLGQRTFLMGEQDIPILQLHSLTFQQGG